MNVKELRQGNLIFGLYENEDCEEIYKTECSFLGFNPFDNYIFVDSKSIGFDEFVGFEPITLTEEWLLKLGFSLITETSAGIRYGYVVNGIFNSDMTFIFWKTTKEKGKFFRKDLELKYVHQLQNLYFALTGEELTLNNVV